MNIGPYIRLGGILVTAMASELNDEVTGIALADIRGGLGISYDPATWFSSLYTSAQIVGFATSPWLMLTFTLRRFTLFVVALCCLSSALIPFSPNIAALYGLRILQGLSGGFAVPLLLTAALRVLTPETRLYGLAIYALTATFTPSLGAPLAALWTEWVGWQFAFLQAVPLCAAAAASSWYGLPSEDPKYERFRQLDWRDLLLLIMGFGAFSTMLIQGNRLDWFNSQTICVMALISAACIPLFLVNEWFHPLPFVKLQLLARRNLAYGLIALFTFLLVGLSGSTVPIQYLTQVQGFRPIQIFPLTVMIALAQIVMLPALAVLLDRPWADARAVHILGLLLVIGACVGASFVMPLWKVDQFYLWQGRQAVGQPMVVMTLLVFSTNSLRSPDEAPFTSALLNTQRGISEVVGIWLLDLINRWRGGLHYSRIADQLGQDAGRTGVPGGPAATYEAVQAQVAVLTASDTYLVLACIGGALIAVALVLTQYTPPPRVQFAKH